MSELPAPARSVTQSVTIDRPARGDAATGVLDHDFRDPDEPGWMATVPARVVANGRGADFVMTIFQPPELDDVAFERELAVVATELSTLKEVLERP
jgi:hypothetical protein